MTDPNLLVNPNLIKDVTKIEKDIVQRRKTIIQQIERDKVGVACSHLKSIDRLFKARQETARKREQLKKNAREYKCSNDMQQFVQLAIGYQHQKCELRKERSLLNREIIQLNKTQSEREQLKMNVCVKENTKRQVNRDIANVKKLSNTTAPSYHCNVMRFEEELKKEKDRLKNIYEVHMKRINQELDSVEFLKCSIIQENFCLEEGLRKLDRHANFLKQEKKRRLEYLQRGIEVERKPFLIKPKPRPCTNYERRKERKRLKAQKLAEAKARKLAEAELRRQMEAQKLAMEIEEQSMIAESVEWIGESSNWLMENSAGSIWSRSSDSLVKGSVFGSSPSLWGSTDSLMDSLMSISADKRKHKEEVPSTKPTTKVPGRLRSDQTLTYVPSGIRSDQSLTYIPAGIRSDQALSYVPTNTIVNRLCVKQNLCPKPKPKVKFLLEKKKSRKSKSRSRKKKSKNSKSPSGKKKSKKSTEKSDHCAKGMRQLLNQKEELSKKLVDLNKEIYKIRFPVVVKNQSRKDILEKENQQIPTVVKEFKRIYTKNLRGSKEYQAYRDVLTECIGSFGAVQRICAQRQADFQSRKKIQLLNEPIRRFFAFWDATLNIDGARCPRRPTTQDLRTLIERGECKITAFIKNCMPCRLKSFSIDHFLTVYDQETKNLVRVAFEHNVAQTVDEEMRRYTRNKKLEPPRIKDDEPIWTAPALRKFFALFQEYENVKWMKEYRAMPPSEKQQMLRDAITIRSFISRRNDWKQIYKGRRKPKKKAIVNPETESKFRKREREREENRKMAKGESDDRERWM